MSAPDRWALQLDVTDAERRKRERLIRLNTDVIPRVRVLGFALLAAGALVHNYLLIGDVQGQAWFRLLGLIAVYCVATWYLLHLFYADLRPHFDLGVTFLALDMAVFSLVIHATGAERSWIFFLPLFRVMDQTTTSFRRSLAFAHLAPLSYLAVIAHVVLVEGRSVAPAPEVAKALFIYTGSLYIALIARSADERHKRMTQVIRMARSLIGQLERKSEAFETSSRELRASLGKQERLAEENATLYAAAQRERARQAQIFDTTSDGLIFVGPDGRIEAANLRAGDLLGFDPASVIGTEMARAVSRLYSIGEGDSFLPTLHNLLTDPWGGGQGDLQQPATGRVLHWVAQAARDARGESAGLTFTFQDVTRQRDLLRQLEDKSRLLEDLRARSEDANRAKGEFLANISHEIRTPLSAIIGMTRHMQDAGADMAMLARIEQSADSLMAIISDILDFSKIESRKLTLEHEAFGLRETVTAAIDTLRIRAAEKRLALNLEVLPDVPDALVGDATRLRQVLLNLLGNAIKFTDKGEVRLRIGVASSLAEETCLHFAVSDTGIGIPKDKQELIFDAFAQADGGSSRRYGGTGLGLSISSRLVELMGGDIWVESEAGAGSAFRFTAKFRLHDGSTVAPRPQPRASEPPPRRDPMTVLVVEDEDVHRELVAAMLLGRGHRVITARNGREALVEMSRHKVDIILMDLQMPEMDGFQATITIREWERTAGGHVPIVALTASALEGEPDRCMAAGMERLVTKPVARDLLFQLVEDLGAAAEAATVPPELAGRSAFLAGLGEDVALARKLVEIFIAQSPKLMTNIRTALDAADAEALRKAAHALKGTISNFPAGPARGAAARMEVFGFDGDFAAAKDLYPTLEQEVERLKTLLPALI
jgi:signal transduction histidine kinase/CheY-like chemotaxis protein